MATSSKKPRRTAQRILEVTLELLNRFGEPNVSTNLISAELGISPGNLYYHYPAKEQLINALLAEFEEALTKLAPSAQDVRQVDDAWLFCRAWLELSWRYRFLYRDLNDLLSKNRHLEQHFQSILAQKQQAMETMIKGLHQGGALSGPAEARPPLITAMMIVLTYWLNFEFMRDPRRAMEPTQVDKILSRGAFQVISMLGSLLTEAQCQQLLALNPAGPAPDVKEVKATGSPQRSES